MRSTGREEGFSLVEMMVALLIIGILVAIALPVFLGARSRATDRAAQSNLGNALIAAKTWLAETQAYSGFDQTEGEVIEPSLTWVPLGDPAVGEVAVGLASASDLHLVAESSTGSFFCLHDDVGVGTTFGTGATYAAVDTEAECAASSW